MKYGNNWTHKNPPFASLSYHYFNLFLGNCTKPERQEVEHKLFRISGQNNRTIAVCLILSFFSYFRIIFLLFFFCPYIILFSSTKTREYFLNPKKIHE